MACAIGGDDGFSDDGAQGRASDRHTFETAAETEVSHLRSDRLGFGLAVKRREKGVESGVQ